MKFCRHCKMNSRTEDACEWCLQPMTGNPADAPAASVPPAAPPPLPGTTFPAAAHPLDRTMPVPPPVPPADPGLAVPPPGGAYRVTLTGEIIAEAPPAAPAFDYPTMAVPPSGARTGPVAPGLPAPAPGMRPGYPAPAGRPASGYLPTSAVTMQTARAATTGMQRSWGEKFELFLAIAMPTLALSVLLLYFVPDIASWVVVADLFVVALALGGTGAIGSYDDAYMDVGAVLIASFLLGPLLGVVAYGIVGLIKQEWNTAILGVLLSHIAVRMLLGIAFLSNDEAQWMVAQVALMNLLGFFAVFVSFAGWMLSSFFRPLDE